jgi:DNA invertase Pin-like site-specific DNA recombinase
MLTGMGSIAREYLRVSHDQSGRARSVTEQHDDNERAGQQHGFTLNGEAYSDVSVSASRYSRKVRGDFARLLADLEHGRFGADLLVMWESSRGSRRVGEWASLIDRLEDASVKVFVTTHGRVYDCANARDRRTLLEDAIDAAYQSDKQSAAIARALAANARDGRPHGRMQYGFKRVYDVLPSGRRVLVAQLAEPVEAAVVSELFERLRKGHSLRSIAGDFLRRGVRTRTGKPFTPQHLGQMALCPAYAGYRTHIPGAKAGGVFRGPLDGATRAVWPALVDAETFWTVRELLLDPARQTSRPGRGVHLLSMIAACDVCGAELTSRNRRGDRMYVCRARGCVAILADELDGHAEKIMLAYLARPDVVRRLRAVRAADAELVTVRTDLAQARSELSALRAAGRARKVTVATLLEIEPALAGRVGELEAREEELRTPPALSVLPPGKDVARRWKAAPMSARRMVARMLLAPSMLGELRLGRTPTPGRRAAAVAERVEWRRD